MKEEMEKYLQDFSNQHSELLALRANIAAINRMLIQRGRTEELFDSLKHVIETYKTKIEVIDAQEEKKEQEK